MTCKWFVRVVAGEGKESLKAVLNELQEKGFEIFSVFSHKGDLIIIYRSTDEIPTYEVPERNE